MQILGLAGLGIALGGIAMLIPMYSEVAFASDYSDGYIKPSKGEKAALVVLLLVCLAAVALVGIISIIGGFYQS